MTRQKRDRPSKYKTAPLPDGHLKAWVFRRDLADYFYDGAKVMVHRFGKVFEVTIKEVE